MANFHGVAASFTTGLRKSFTDGFRVDWVQSAPRCGSALGDFQLVQREMGLANKATLPFDS